MDNDKQTILKHKVTSWRQQVEAHQARMLRSYYAAKPGRRDRSFKLIRSRLGDMMTSVLEVERTMAPRAEHKE